MKNPEAFRASVYARAKREKERLKKRRNTSLSVAMVLLVAALAVPLVRSANIRVDPYTVPETERQEARSANQAALSNRMVLLVGTKAVELENEDQQKDFVNQYKAALNLEEGEDLPLPALDLYRAIHSTEELSALLAELPEAAGRVALDYDEDFFAGHDLYVMPMELPAQQGEVRETTTAWETASLPAQLTTIPDGDGTVPGEETSEDAAETQTEPDEATSEAAPQSLPESVLLEFAGGRILLLVPVEKG